MKAANNVHSFQFVDVFGDVTEVELDLNRYRDGDNLYVGLVCVDEETGFRERFSVLTVNVPEYGQLPYLHSAIDTNNLGVDAVSFITENNLGVVTPYVLESGFCHYPVVAFNEDVLKRIDPEFLAEYKNEYDDIAVENEPPSNIADMCEGANACYEQNKKQPGDGGEGNLVAERRREGLGL